MLNESEKIGVLNYNENSVSIRTSPTESYCFEKSMDGVTPTIIFLTLGQIRYANNYNAFRNGLLFFEKKKEKDVYEELHINDWENILTNNDIREIIIHPTFEGLNKIIAIKDDSTFERVRAAYHKLRMENTCDISIRVAQIIDMRYRELQNKKLTSSIVLEKKDIAAPIDSKEVEDLKSANAAMQKQLEEMQKMMAELLANKKDEAKPTAPTKQRTSTTNRRSK